MSLLSLLLGEKKKTASVARERLQIILAHERSGRGAPKPDYLPALQRELLAWGCAKSKRSIMIRLLNGAKCSA